MDQDAKSRSTYQAEFVQRSDARALAVDMFHPESEPRRTAVILLHGGGWAAGHRHAMHAYAAYLAQAGFVAMAAEYRLTGEAPWPAQIRDVKAVIRWARENATALMIDPGKIVVEGFSAGGHLALLAAGTARLDVFGETASNFAVAADVAAVISFFAPPLLTREVFPVRPPPAVNLLGPEGNEDVALAASPLHYVTPAFPPCFLLNGLNDPFMPYTLTHRLFEALMAAGAPVDLHYYHGQTHEFSALPSQVAPVQAEVVAFIDRHVVDPACYRRENIELNVFAREPGPRAAPPATK
jgi:acetyl esterase/lipase